MPIAVTHDNLYPYRAAFKNEFYTNAKPQTTEARSISIRQRELNNRMERLNQTFSDRNKTQRTFDQTGCAQFMADGVRMEYTFARPHMTLNGRTPAEAAGIDLRLGENTWKAPIEINAQAHRPKVIRVRRR